MKKGTVITLIMMLSLLLQPVLTYADTAVPDATKPVSNSTQPATVPTSPATSAPAGGNAGSTTLPPILDANGKPVNPGTLPDSPLYWLSNLIGKIQVFLTFDPVKKVALEENQALQKLAAAQKMVEKGKPELAQKALGEYTEKVQETQKFFEQIKDPNSATAQTLQKAMAQVDANNIQVLSGLLDKLPPQAAEKLAVNIVRSMEKAVAKMTDEEKKQVKTQWQEASKHMNPENLDAQTADALAKFQAALGLKGAMAQDEDPNQPVRTIGEEKKAAAAEQEREQEQKQEQNEIKEPTEIKEQEKNKVKQQEQQRDKQSEQDSEESKNKGKDSNHDDSEED